MYGNSAMIISVSLWIFGMIFGGRHSHMKKKNLINWQMILSLFIIDKTLLASS